MYGNLFHIILLISKEILILRLDSSFCEALGLQELAIQDKCNGGFQQKSRSKRLNDKTEKH